MHFKMFYHILFSQRSYEVSRRGIGSYLRLNCLLAKRIFVGAKEEMSYMSRALGIIVHARLYFILIISFYMKAL